ncbi:PREDICTED: probable phosphorylase b kinase regulatory subunit alpha isoform X1 [Trachymyrmex cornetzi]|uniref:probable phosphorylase b kinase regulatory subunit alpha isoform X1 n=1 Tax=Trachymyrmex cornetzi TaxID=471704 RepID=UPI00084EFA26|nr:PREDICTED: probable phosphorylase b kinase regulatory subunit alpha isoform X1 [Trachymyrmex cornetzi]XP_018360710.1 PREDICTED: probable phosphorylase b kinase regulatory subunit alpha isoform X1 [Trachymyrmex cornetzi]XP_018360711.1 PREDICTED: probable phosphorylase b kinase regulatory subunit alpha isoform X1 [Trachymyrmex cornetzi]XP_018360712.1 PREDICTED: probable phosphorylase b kinase regulatory subunit alpha isoform X1 [Trachymyrmex cornetzi]XP_018360713.1 PREDICTED: probable phosphor
MRSRSNSGVRLDYYQRIVHKIIMNYQNPVTGLFPASPDNDHAWIRDNVYCILAVWGLSMAYKKIADADEDRAKTYELEQSCVKLMRGLLMAMMQQKEKVEKFKSTQNPHDALHAKYSSTNGQSVVGDTEWGHLQIDAISLYLLILGQMTASGLQIVFNLDEVAFIQNLVFYIESAYCTPDYGIWERGDKTNHGLPELNASSIGMAKAAMEAMNELDLFGARGGPTSVIHVLADEAQKCQAVLQSMLPRESNSKELDSGLLSIISFPAFAVDEPNLIHETREAITKKLQGRYGCKRFLRDGYKTPKEDMNRLYYEPWELRMFENIECEWPLFFCYLILDYCFQGNKEAVETYTKQLEEVMIKAEDGMKLVPELYSVAPENVSAEYAEPGSQNRIALGRCPFKWAQSLYILGKLLQEGFLAVGELDPLNRRLCSEKKPDVVVQVVILAEDTEIREKIAQHDIHVQTIAEVAPIEVQPAKVLSHLYTYLGRNKKLGLSGRKSRDVGILSTSKLYSLHDKIFAFTPQLTDMTRFYIASDYELMIDIFKGEINFLKSSWQNMLGRPLVVMPLKNIHLDQGKIPLAMITTLKKLKSGYINGTRVSLGNLNDFLSTSCITNLSFLGSSEDGRPDKLNPQVQQYLEEHLMRPFPHRTGLLNKHGPIRTGKHLRRKMSVKGAIKKTRSIAVEPEILGMAGEDRRHSTILITNPFIEVTDTTLSINATQPVTIERTPSPTDELLSWKNSPKTKHRTISETQYAETEVEELLSMLRETESLEEQGDILQYIVDSKGLLFDTGVVEEGHPVLIKDLLKSLYEKACQQKMWGIVRHSAGMLGKRVEDLAKAVTDLLVRQKQVTVGMPPSNEHTIVAPLPENELRALIHQAYGDDESTAMLTQELLVYLAMFIRTEPQLFHEMLRLRVGLIIQVMATELSRTLICTGEEASEHLLNLSPFEMKNLLHHIMSGKEFAISSVGRGNFSVISCKSSRVSKKSQIGGFLSADQNADNEAEADRQGQWLRRRRLDGALNRVPRDFYPRVWQVLEKCHGLAIEGRVLPQNLTQEMTSGELKFALAVETVLNTIPQPEYRQLVVEALMVLTLVTEYNIAPSLGGLIEVEHLVHKANAIFLEDQMAIDGDATLCCAKPKEQREMTAMGTLLCGGAAYICQHFYDTAPSGSYGTMTYITRAVAVMLDCLPKDGDLECSIS